jgi:hypothetical protein
VWGPLGSTPTAALRARGLKPQSAVPTAKRPREVPEGWSGAKGKTLAFGASPVLSGEPVLGRPTIRRQLHLCESAFLDQLQLARIKMLPELYTFVH